MDGTLTASGEGITKCVQYAMSKFGIQEPDLKKLEVFVGPPLKEQFMKYCGLTEAQAIEAVGYYRERYTEKGMFENQPYPLIPELLRELKDRGYLLAVASSKPTYFVTQILDHFGLTGYFHEIVGAELDGSRTQKEEVIGEALRRLGLESSPREAIMVGDKDLDVYGARSHGMKCVAVSYGYGTLEELTRANPCYIAEDVEQLGEFFLDNPLQQHSPGRKVWRTVYPIGMHFVITQLVAVLVFFCFALAGDGGALADHTALLTGLASLAVIPVSLLLMRMDEGLRNRNTQWGVAALDGLIVFLLGAAYGQIANSAISMLHLSDLFPGYQDQVYDVIMLEHPLVLLLSVGIAAPVAEELIFRGLIYRRLKDYVSWKTAMVISALLFGVYHGNMLQFVYATLLGMVFVLLMEQSGGLWGAILAHMGANLWSVFLSLYSLDLMKAGGGLVLGALVMLMFVGGIFGILYLRRERRNYPV